MSTSDQPRHSGRERGSGAVRRSSLGTRVSASQPSPARIRGQCDDTRGGVAEAVTADGPSPLARRRPTSRLHSAPLRAALVGDGGADPRVSTAARRASIGLSGDDPSAVVEAIVVVDERRRVVQLGAQLEHGEPRAEIAVIARHANPVLETRRASAGRRRHRRDRARRRPPRPAGPPPRRSSGQRTSDDLSHRHRLPRRRAPSGISKRKPMPGSVMKYRGRDGSGSSLWRIWVMKTRR